MAYLLHVQLRPIRHLPLQRLAQYRIDWNSTRAQRRIYKIRRHQKLNKMFHSLDHVI